MGTRRRSSAPLASYAGCTGADGRFGAARRREALRSGCALSPNAWLLHAERIKAAHSSWSAVSRPTSWPLPASPTTSPTPSPHFNQTFPVKTPTCTF